MVRLWDYFMRRKVRLFLLLIAFFFGGCIGYKLFYHEKSEPSEPEYISISSWDNDVEIPYTGENVIVNSSFAVMLPKEIVALAKPEQTPIESDDLPDSEMIQNPETEVNEEVAESDPHAEDLDNLEEPVLLDSAVMEVLPPREEISDEVLSEAVESLAQPAQLNAIINEEENTGIKNHVNLLHDITILLMLVITITFGSYLIYQHFQR